MHDVKHCGFSGCELLRRIEQLALKRKEDGIGVFLILLKAEMFCSRGFGNKDVSNRLELVNSAYAVAYQTLSTNNMITSYIVLPETFKMQKSVRIVAVPNFCEKKEGRFDVIMLENIYEVHKSLSFSDNYLPVRIAKSHYFIHLCKK